MTSADAARAELIILAAQFHEEAIDKHIEGSELTRRATLIEQVAELADDESVIQARDKIMSAMQGSGGGAKGSEGSAEVQYVTVMPGGDA